MKNIIITAVLLVVATMGYAQQEYQLTQFMYNKLYFNPAYAGSHESACITGVYRNQWSGIEGAPVTQGLSFNAPLLNQRVGIGINLNRNTIGIQERWTLDGAYAYRLPVSRGHLALGLQASMRFIGSDYNDPRLITTSPLVDNAIPIGEQSKYVPNFGFGVYYNSDNLYVGLSAPRILTNNIDFNDVVGTIGREVRHLYFMAGLRIEMSEKLDFQPQILLKYAERSPFDADINASFIYDDFLNLGLTYRAGGDTNSSGESIDFLAGVQFSNILLSLSYDFTLSELNNYSNGSLELVLRYCLGKSEGSDYVNPRFF